MATAGDIYEVKHYCVLGAQAGIMVSHWLVSAVAGTGATDQTIADGFSNSFATQIRALLASAATYVGATAQKIRPLPIAVFAQSTQGAGVGALLGDAMPGQVSGLFTLRTALAGRANRGRKYVPFPSEQVNDTNGTPTVAYLSSLTALRTLFTAGATAGSGGNTVNMDPVIYHRTAGTTTLITGGFNRTKWATQRRRGSLAAADRIPF